MVHNRDFHRTTQNSGVSSTGHDGEKYYGQLEEILELNYLGGCKVVLFRCKWFKTDKKHCVTKNNITSICTQTEGWKNDQYILATQVDQVFYLDEPSKGGQRAQSNKYWKVVQEVNHRKIWDRDIFTEDNEVDIIHGSTSSDISLSANLDDLTYTSWSRDEATEVNVSLEDDEADDEADEEGDDDADSDEGNDAENTPNDFETDNECEGDAYMSDESD